MFSITLHDDMVSKIKVSYDALSVQEKHTFLDIGCSLVREETWLAIRVLTGLYGSNIVQSLESLNEKCFVDFHYDVQCDDEIKCNKRENSISNVSFRVGKHCLLILAISNLQ